MVEDDPLIPSVEAAEFLRVKPNTLPAWRSTGKGPRFVKIGRAIFYRRSAILEWVRAQERDPRAA